MRSGAEGGDGARGWRLLIDRGGTFTDVVALDPQGRTHVRKLLSATDEQGRDAVERALAEHPAEELRLGTTVATNALLERRGERVLLLTTKGFADLLEIGHQDRPDIFALAIEKRALLHAAVVELDERVLADGTVERPLTADEVRRALASAGFRDGAPPPFDAVAVVLINACAHPGHELLAGDVAAAAGVPWVSLSHRTAAEIGAVGRGDTTVADAYLTPLLRRSLERVRAPGRRVLFMQSSGGLADADHFSGKDAVLSGPAGGVVAVARVAARAGRPKVIGLDMGGTSTDVCRCDGEPERSYETVVAGVRIRAPMLSVITVAAGGGSILDRRDGRFTVGPRSAGADPGPAAYGRGGPATLTDANLVLGRVRPEWFPHLTLDLAAARARLAEFGDPVEAAAGFVAIANEHMAAAIRQISTARGYDVRDHALCGFGGAAGQHVCALAALLGMTEVLLHPAAGVLSAWGLGLADARRHEVQPVLDAGQARGDVPPDFPETRAVEALMAQGADSFEVVDVERSVDVRYVGVDETLNVPWSPHWAAEFVERHRALFGFVKHGHPVEIVNARAEAVGRIADLPEAWSEPRPHRPEPLVRAAGNPGGNPTDGRLDADVYRRTDLGPGALIDGPALLVEDHATTVVDAGWSAEVDGHGVLRLRPAGVTAHATARTPAAATVSIGAERDPVSLEIMSNRFMSLAWQMGEHLRRVSHSTNIKERLDYSCALFDPDGGLIADAPHIPVHLGAMGETVRCLLDSQAMRPGDTWLTNDPYHGGSHLPDLTVITPVFRSGGRREARDGPAFLVANRGHHADVGGIAPGSMPPDSRSIADEGALFRDFLLVRDGVLREREVTDVLAAAGTRGIPERLADLAAQVACNHAGARLLGGLCDELGLDVVHAWMGHLRRHAAEVMSDVVAGLRGGRFEDGLDDGSRIRVEITVRDGRARVDFSGTSPQQPGNRNAPKAVTLAAVLYVFRTLAARPIPLNAGCFEPLDIVIPAGSLLDPRHPAAVVGGNVETSQRVVDVLYGALDALAASQGTMNNLTFGDDSFGYYETLCGGAGAGPGFHGASAVHTHMTNTRITDPEVLERRYPVILREFSVRRGSGGKGTWNGGDGVVRRIEFRRPLRCSMLAERRVTAPFGLRAEPGAKGEHEISPEGVVVRTPGGGGFTPP